MTEIEADLAAINARAAPILAEQARLIKALNAGITLIVTVAMVGLWFAACSLADETLKAQDLRNQENISWKR